MVTRILAVDIGNTNTHFALVKSLGVLASTSVKTSEVGSSGIYRKFKGLRPGVICYSSVNRKGSLRFESNCKRFLKQRPLNITRDFSPVVKNVTVTPKTTGQDRLSNVSWAYYKYKKACCVVDVGSAVNFDVVDSRGRFIGGLIGPGLALSLEAMHSKLDQIPRIKTESVKTGIGNDTRSALQLGSALAVRGLLKLGLDVIREKFKQRIRVIGTGNDAKIFREYFDEIDKHITLRGLVVSYLLYETRR